MTTTSSLQDAIDDPTAFVEHDGLMIIDALGRFAR
jgi:hypothetical protein